MSNTDDIYRKEPPPPPLARKRRRAHSAARRPAHAQGTISSELGSNPQERHPRKKVVRKKQRSTYIGGVRVPSGSSSSHVHGRVHYYYPASNTAKVLWAVLGLMLVAYLAILAKTMLSGKSEGSENAASPESETVATAAATNSDAEAEARTATIVTVDDIRELIRKSEAAANAVANFGNVSDKARHADATERLESALENSPEHEALKVALAERYAMEQNHEKARDLLLEALAALPTDAKAQLTLARTLSSLREFESAAVIAEWALETNPYSIEAHDIAAVAYINAETPRLAIPHLKRIKVLDSSNSSAQNQLAQVYSKIGEAEKAIDIYTGLLDIDDRDSVTYYHLALCYVNENMPQNAVDILRRASDLFGRQFVRTWIQAVDFDPVREDKDFIRFSEDLLVLSPDSKTNSAKEELAAD